MTPDPPPSEPCRLCRKNGRTLDGLPVVKRVLPGGFQICLICDAVAGTLPA
ncbi:hypothetical protein [Microbispora sp. CSR-4]|uniref:hypothetical protein n=1 Tax=Microbispora sp. CSR-4 TaxID=2592813 RepID=UPI00164F257D|nr:hypothetical protein [Microbispora sp. CSR-4]